MRKITLLLALLLISATTLKAARPISYESPRSLAMGGAFVAVADDHQAMFSNPAGLGLNQKKAFSVINSTFIINDDYESINSRIDRLSDAELPASRNENYSALLEAMGKVGHRNWSNLAYYLGSEGFAAALYYNEKETYSVSNPVSPVLESQVDKDTVLMGSVARSFNEAQVLFKDRAMGWWGTTIKFASRNSASTRYGVKDFSALTAEAVKDANLTGATLDFDLGALWQLNNPLNTSLGLMVGNVLGSEFSSEVGSLNRHYAAGISIKPLTGPPERNERLVFALDYWDDGADTSFFNKVRLGSQLRVSDHIHLLAGLRSGYLTGGFALAWRDLRLQAATYSEELGKRPGDKEDRRYTASLNLQF